MTSTEKLAKLYRKQGKEELANAVEEFSKSVTKFNSLIDDHCECGGIKMPESDFCKDCI